MYEQKKNLTELTDKLYYTRGLLQKIHNMTHNKSYCLFNKSADELQILKNFLINTESLINQVEHYLQINPTLTPGQKLPYLDKTFGQPLLPYEIPNEPQILNNAKDAITRVKGHLKSAFQVIKLRAENRIFPNIFDDQIIFALLEELENVSTDIQPVFEWVQRPIVNPEEGVINHPLNKDLERWKREFKQQLAHCQINYDRIRNFNEAIKNSGTELPEKWVNEYVVYLEKYV